MSDAALLYLGSNPRLYTTIGAKRGDQIRLENCRPGCGLYGPYVNLPSGRYYALVRFAAGHPRCGRGIIDVCTGTDAQVVISAPFNLNKLAPRSHEIGIAFQLDRAASQCQVRLHCNTNVTAIIEQLEIRFREVAASSIEAILRDGIGEGEISPPLVRLGRTQQLKGFLKHPLAETRTRLRAAKVDRLAPPIAERTLELIARESAFRFTKQSGVASQAYQVWLPDPVVFGLQDGDYMTSANCIARDFYHREFARFCERIALAPALHRKLWEFAFIWHHLSAEGAIRPGARGVGFGVGRERFPSLFAKHGCKVLATDAPVGVASAGWSGTGQHSSSLDELFFSDIVSEPEFLENVEFVSCDMNAIGDDISEFDFCWSSCSFEHLGSIENGLDFVVNSVEKVLKIGGVACHTSELNISSNDRTLDSGDTVLFRRRDIEHLAQRLTNSGHQVKYLPIEPGDSFIDYLVDLPPYSNDMSLRLKIDSYVTTSFGLVVRRGR
jgi:hypothetical protein